MKDQLQQWLTEINQSASILPEEIPNIELYMDQVLTLLEDQLSSSKRYDDDKVMTKTMINNYSKEKLLPPSHKKKYAKHHIELLNLIYQYKSVLAIRDIYTLLSPFINDPSALHEFYSRFLQQEMIQKEILTTDLQDADTDDLRLLASTLLTRAIYEKRLAEKMLDFLDSNQSDEMKQ